jgi:hypothetical protein
MAAVRFVLANRLMVHVGGTEAHLLTVGEHLQRLGHEVVIYAPELGPYADHVRRCGIDVVDQLRKLPTDCDVVFAQDTIVAYDVAERYPAALSVYRVCGDVHDFQIPPQLERMVDFIVVLSDRYARVVEACAIKAPILRMRVPVDVDRLTPLGGIRKRPRRAVMLGNYPDRFELVKTTWEQQGIEVVQVGGVDESYDVANAVAGADIVVAKARAALEAMACGRAVYIYDTFGGDGWVTPTLYHALEADNFAGQATDRVIGSTELGLDLAEYDREMGVANRDLILQHHNARDHVIELLTAFDTHESGSRQTAPFRELSRLTALQWSWHEVARTHQVTAREVWERLVRSEQLTSDALQATESAERDRENAIHELQAMNNAKGELIDTRRQVERLEQELSKAVAQLRQMRQTRVWRLATYYWRLKRRPKGMRHL